MRYRLALVLDGRRSVARAAAFLMAVSPAAVFFGRIVIPDTPMMFFTALALVGFVEFAAAVRRGGWSTGASALTIACLLKLPAVFVGPAIVALLVRGRGWTRLPRSARLAGRRRSARDHRRVVLASARRSSSGPA